MKSSNPLAELALRSIREAEPGSFGALDPAERHDLERIQRMTHTERLAELFDIMQRTEAFGLPPVSLEPIHVNGPLRM